MNTQDQHPLLFGLIARSIVRDCGGEGEKALSAAMKHYGYRRGRRMADKAKQHGYATGLDSYLLFGEFDVWKVGNVSKITQKKPYTEVQMSNCHWNTVWNNHGLSEYGKYYCRDIDVAIMSGFSNDAARLEVPSTMSEGSNVCIFKYIDWPLKTGTMLRYMFNKKKFAKIAVKPWDYHTADIYQALSEKLVPALGKQAGASLQSALAEFEKKCGPEARERIMKIVGETDFNVA